VVMNVGLVIVTLHIPRTQNGLQAQVDSVLHHRPPTEESHFLRGVLTARGIDPEIEVVGIRLARGRGARKGREKGIEDGVI